MSYSLAKALPFTVEVVSVRGHSTRMPGDFATQAQARDRIKSELRGLSCYYQAWIKNGNGERVARGYRGGYNGTGENWVWRQMS